MVVRKPVGTSKGQAPREIPYPITPTSPRGGRAKTATALNTTTSEPYTAGTGQYPWNGDSYNDFAGQQEEGTIDLGLPPSLVPGKRDEDTERERAEAIPAVLKVGSAEVTPRSSWESQRSSDPSTGNHISEGSQLTRARPEHATSARPRSTSNNPYRRRHESNGKVVEKTDIGGESSADIWGADTVSSQPQNNSTSLKHPFAEPWMHFETPSGEAGVPEAQAGFPIAENKTTSVPISQMLDDADERALKAPEVHVQSPGASPNGYSETTSLRKGHQHFPDDVTQNVAISSIQAGSIHYPTHVLGASSPAPSQGIGIEPVHSNNGLSQNEFTPSSDTVPPRMGPPYSEGELTALQNGRSEEKEATPSSLSAGDKLTEGTSTKSQAQAERQEAANTKRSGETYQIRLINWYDASSSNNPRRSPIMVQNANGPCPLLALVNALVLSTPSDINTALLETLRVREQVSLGLLLDAVIDELMSGRRGDAVGNLPDVTDLYAFLVTLHTGMNVNPQFVPVEEPVNLMDAPIDEDVPMNLNAARKAGGFESTREMKLYSAFSIPLIHGWIPPRNHPAFAALKRSAKTYEDAQNLMFREEELEDKLQQQGLSPEEQMILEDIASVKYFLNSTATQLTGYGLDTMTETLTPGSVAILFRNDHFSTLYRHPRSGQLLTLVTDMGYAGHDEVVWESLVDVSGEGCEFFSGDFRPVGNVVGDSQRQQPGDDESGWTTVEGKSRKAPRQSHSASAQQNLPPLSTLSINDDIMPVSPNIEQEDHDLALAMQLQEEEEERDRQEAAARRREDELSQAYLDSSDAQGRRTFPGFGRGATGAHSGPPPPPRGNRRTSSSDDAPPPSYEQAAKGPAYIPPATHPAHPNAPPGPNNSTPRPQGQRPRQASAYSEHAASYSAGSPVAGPSRRGHQARGSASGRGGVESNVVRRRSAGPNSAVSLDDSDKKDKDCIVM